MNVILRLPPEPDMGRLFAIGLSGLLHATMLTGLTFVQPVTFREIPQQPRRPIQLLQLNFPGARPVQWTPSRPTRAAQAMPEPDAGPSGAAAALVSKRGAPQTVKVANAQSDLVLQVPVPFAATRDDLRKHNDTPEVVNLAQSATAPLEVPDDPPPPPAAVSILSLPDRKVVAESVVVIPKVDQTAGPPGKASDMKGSESRDQKLQPNTQALEQEARRAAQEKAAQERVAQERAAAQAKATAQEKAAREIAARERATQEKVAQERAAAQEKVAQEKAAQERAATQDKAIQDQAAQRAAVQDKAAEDKTTLEGTTRIELPRDGAFAMSLQGESRIRQFPEVESRSMAKLVSSVYLKVGLKKSWVLEFSPNEANGNTEPIAPPWLYDIYRPDELQRTPEEGSLLVAGMINANGLFENLQLLLPIDWPKKDHLLQALNHWKFRPGTRKGEAVALKILLIIPQVPEPQ